MDFIPKIWVIGALGTRANKELLWTDDLEYFADPDVLIFNLVSLTPSTLSKMNPTLYNQILDTLIQKFLRGSTIIIITEKYFEVKSDDKLTLSNYGLFPIHVKTVTVPKGESINYFKNGDISHTFKSYLELVKHFNFFLKDFSHPELSKKINSSGGIHEISKLDSGQIQDNISNPLGEIFFDAYNEGKVVFLPYPEISIEKAIDKIIDTFMITDLVEEKEPIWASNILINHLTSVETELTTLQLKINNLQVEKQKLRAFRKLLYSNGKPLENIVSEAFKLLGFNEIKRKREDNKEDLVFEFKSNLNYEYGVLEIKGSGSRTSERHLTQCNKWVDEYFDLQKKHVKGIFISNQHRLDSYPKSKEDRLHFEPNELEYAERKDICIIPACVLFEAVNNVLIGKTRPREDFEKLFSQSKGLIKEL